MFHFDEAPPLSLYVHLPWCVRKCPYCDFNSHQHRGVLPERQYLDALIADLTEEAAHVNGRSVHSVFIGGGTPSLFSPESIGCLLDAARATLTFTADAEITLEANPGSVDAAKFTEFRAAGVNRLSIGVQSFADDALVRIGRIHGRKEALRAAEAAHGTGFENFNLDLMYGLPGQSPAAALADLRTACALEPTHLSHYQLTLEPGTPFYKSPPLLPDEAVVAAIETEGRALLEKHGYARYEISAYARPNFRCRHNLNYWEFGDYIGIGAGAHGKCTAQGIVRRAKLKHPQSYMSKAGSAAVCAEQHMVSAPEARFEFMLNALRLSEGFDMTLYTARSGLSWESAEPMIAQAEYDGLIECTGTRVRASARGFDFLNELTARFLPEQSPHAQ